jgi:hypothetical protein
MLNILGCKENINQNNIEISFHSSQNGYHQEYKEQMLTRMKWERNTYTLLVGIKLVQSVWKAI